MEESVYSDSQPSQELPTRELESCPLCASPECRPAGFAYQYRGVRLPGVRCARCALVYLRRQPTEEGLTQLYDSGYFDSDYHCGHEEQSYFSCADEQIAAAGTLLEMIAAERAPGRLLEIGCAGGYFLQAARQQGWSPIGVEISDDAARFAREELQLEVLTGTVTSVAIEPASLDAVYMGDVLEHVPAPRDTVRRIHDLLRPGGVFLVAGPVTINSLDRRAGMTAYRLLGRQKILREPPYHLIEFTPPTLRALLHQCGFDVRWIRESKIAPTLGNPRRRPVGEHVAKLGFDAVNWLLTRVGGRFGDRAIALAIKPESR